MRILKSTLTAIIMLSAYTTFGQDCNFDVDGKDEFTGEAIRKFDQRMGSITTHWNITIEQKGNKYFIGLKMLSNNIVETQVAKGDKFYLKLENKTVIPVAADQNYTPSIYTANGGAQSTILSHGEVDKETIKKLGASPITDIRITIGGNDFTQSKIMDRQAKKMMEHAACMAADK